jgi:hypothetical protein
MEPETGMSFFQTTWDAFKQFRVQARDTRTTNNLREDV